MWASFGTIILTAVSFMDIKKASVAGVWRAWGRLMKDHHGGTNYIQRYQKNISYQVTGRSIGPHSPKPNAHPVSLKGPGKRISYPKLIGNF